MRHWFLQRLTALDCNFDNILAILSSPGLLEPILPQGLDGASMAPQYFNPAAPEFVPVGVTERLAALTIQKVFRAFRARHQFLLKVRAATAIQRAVCAFLRRCGFYYDTCSTCRRKFGEMGSDGAWEGDACDDCGAPTCSPCLSEVYDVKGEWQLCKDCNIKRTSVRCDLRRVPPAF